MKSNYTDLLSQITDEELLKHLYVTQVILIILSLAIGTFTFDTWNSFFLLFAWKDYSGILLGLFLGVVVVLIDLLLMKWLPARYYDDGGINERIFTGKSIFQVAFIAAVVAISEEILFRGVIQTNVGLIVSSLLFGLIHYRYLFNWYLFLNIIILSFLLGLLFQWTGNILVTIMMHFTIDFLLGLAINFKSMNKGSDKYE